MSEKDYAAIAGILHRAKLSAEQYNWDREALLATLSWALAEYFARDDARFDRERFYTAVASGKGTV